MSAERPTTDWSFALRPKWIAGHVLAITLIAVCIAAGFWQLSRHREVSGRNDRIEARQEEAPVDIGTLSVTDPVELEFRTVALNGTWDNAATVTIRNRSLSGAPGCHVVTPLVTTDGRAVAVNRGFTNLPDCDDAAPTFSANSGSRQITGLIRRSQRPGTFGGRDPADGVLETLNRVDVGRISQQYPGSLAPVYVELWSESPASEPAPFPLPAPGLDDGPHLGYTVQWFLFALVGLIGYPLVLRHQARGPRAVRRSAGPVPSAPPAR